MVAQLVKRRQSLRRRGARSRGRIVTKQRAHRQLDRLEGFGADDLSALGPRFNEVSPEARALIEEYASVREPLLRDD
jgi:hypothetical protein